MRLCCLLLLLFSSLGAFARVGTAQEIEDINPAAKAMALAAKLPAYDVVSIHQSKLSTENSSLDTTGDGIVIANASFPEIVEFAYNIASFELISGISGPVASARFDIRAKTVNGDGQRSAKLKDDELQAMTISLLADRFHLRIRLVPKQLTVYEIVIAKGGPKFTLTKAGAYSLYDSWGRENTLVFHNASMPTLAGVLSDSGLHHLVVDRTGLKGAGDLSLRWSSDVAEEEGGKSVVTIFAAVQEQLGLKLLPVKLPVDTLVIDHVEMPTDN